MLSLEKVREITKRLSKEERIILKIGDIKIQKNKASIRIESPIEADKEFLKETLEFYLPYIKVR